MCSALQPRTDVLGSLESFRCWLISGTMLKRIYLNTTIVTILKCCVCGGTPRNREHRALGWETRALRTLCRWKNDVPRLCASRRLGLHLETTQCKWSVLGQTRCGRARESGAGYPSHLHSSEASLSPERGVRECGKNPPESAGRALLMVRSGLPVPMGGSTRREDPQGSLSELELESALENG